MKRKNLLAAVLIVKFQKVLQLFQRIIYPVEVEHKEMKTCVIGVMLVNYVRKTKIIGVIHIRVWVMHVTMGAVSYLSGCLSMVANVEHKISAGF